MKNVLIVDSERSDEVGSGRRKNWIKIIVIVLLNITLLYIYYNFFSRIVTNKTDFVAHEAFIFSYLENGITSFVVPHPIYHYIAVFVKMVFGSVSLNIIQAIIVSVTLVIAFF